MLTAGPPPPRAYAASCSGVWIRIVSRGATRNIAVSVSAAPPPRGPITPPEAKPRSLYSPVAVPPTPPVGEPVARSKDAWRISFANILSMSSPHFFHETSAPNAPSTSVSTNELLICLTPSRAESRTESAAASSCFQARVLAASLSVSSAVAAIFILRLSAAIWASAI